MNRKTGKKFLAMLCAVVVAFTSISFPAKAAEIDFNDTEYAYWDKVTFSDWNIADNTYEGLSDLTFDINYKVNLENKVLCGIVTFSDGWASLYIGGTNYGELWSRVSLQSGVSNLDVDGDGGFDVDTTKDLVLNIGSTSYILNSDTAGTSLVGNAFELKMTYETGNYDDDESEELKLGVWFNDKLYGNEYFYAESPELYNYGCMGIHASGGKLTVASWIPKEEVLFYDTEYADWDTVSFNDWGFDDGTYQRDAETNDIIVKRGYTDTLAGKVFSGDVIFHDGEYEDVSAMLYIGGAGVWNGMCLASDETNQTLNLTVGGETHTLKADVAGLTTFFDKSFNLKLSYEVVDNALQLGIWFENKLYNNEYIPVTKGSNGEGTYEYYLTGELEIMATGWASLTIASDTPKVLNPNLDQITFSDWGYEDGVYQRDAETNDIIVKRGYTDTLAGKVFSGDVIFHDGEYEDVSAMMYIGGAGIWNGMLLASDEANQTLVLTVGGDKYTFHSNVARVTSFFDSEFNLKLSYEVIDNALQLGVWFNDKLYDNEYITVTKGNNGEGTYEYYLTGELEIMATGWASLTITSNEPTTLPKSYDCITPFDFGIVNRTYSGPGAGAEESYGTVNTETPDASIDIDRLIFKTRITFGKSTELRYLRTATSEYNGLEFRMHTDGTIWMLNHLTDGNKIYVNGNEIDTAQTGFFMYAGTAIEGATTFLEQPFNLELTTKFVGDDLLLGVWFNEKLYNGQYIYIQDCKDVCEQGMMLIRSGEGSIILESVEPLKHEETNERYNLADGPYLISGTGTILVNDVEYANGSTLTEAGTYRIVSDNGAFVRNVELYNTGTPSSVLTYEDNVMPIVGFYGPHSNEYSDTVTEQTYQLLEDAGFNLINYIPKDWSVQENQKELIQNLIYAETHNMGLYVWDSTLLTSDLTASGIAKTIAPYSQFDSFKGMHMVDEPATDTYRSDVDNKLATYAAATKAINGYSNLNGYINLYPYDDLYSTVDEYGAYVDEYVDSTEAKFLSHDYYPFTYMDEKEYLENLSIAREKSLQYNIPFWPFIQAGNWRVRTDDLLPEGTPTQGQFMWNVNTSLAYGAKGIQYYTMIMPYHEDYTWYDYGILDKDGNKTDWYDYAQKANNHIAAIDEVLMQADSKAVLAIGTNAQTTTGISTTSYGKLLSVSLSDITEGAVIGVFDYQGKEAFYVVNYDMEQQETITLNFANAYAYQMIQNAVTSTGEGSSCELTIPAGEAVLVVVENDVLSVATTMNLEITDSLSLNYTTRVLDSDVVPTMSFSMENGSASEVVQGIPVEGTENTYQFTYPTVMAQDMDKTITATLTLGTYTKVYEYSVLDYCVRVLSGGYTEEAKDLVVDLVQYGEAVQKYNGVAESELLTTKLAERFEKYQIYDLPDDDASALAYLDTVQDKLTGTVSDDYKWKHATLVLGNKVKVRARFTANDVSNLTVMATINGSTKEVTYKRDTQYTQESVYVLDFDEIYAYEYGEPVQLQFYVNGEPIGQTLTYSVNTYLYAKQDYAGDNADNLKALLLAIHNFGKAAITYHNAYD